MKKLILTAALMMGLSSPVMAHTVAECDAWRPTLDQYSDMRFEGVDWKTAKKSIKQIADPVMRASVLAVSQDFWVPDAQLASTAGRYAPESVWDEKGNSKDFRVDYAVHWKDPELLRESFVYECKGQASDTDQYKPSPDYPPYDIRQIRRDIRRLTDPRRRF